MMAAPFDAVMATLAVVAALATCDALHYRDEFANPRRLRRLAVVLTTVVCRIVHTFARQLFFLISCFDIGLSVAFHAVMVALDVAAAHVSLLALAINDGERSFASELCLLRNAKAANGVIRRAIHCHVTSDIICCGSTQDEQTSSSADCCQ